MNRNTKKGFTIVELIIVIAVIAVLAAVLIPTFSNLIQKAQEAKDTALVRNLNEALAMDTSVSKHTTMDQVAQAVRNNGIDIAKIKASVPGNAILWDSVNDLFAYCKVDKDGNAEDQVYYIPEYSANAPALGRLFAVVSDSKAVPTSKYAVYYIGSAVETMEVNGVGFDAGDAEIGEVIYNGSEKGAIVDIRTNGGNLTIKSAGKDDVNHHGTALGVTIEEVKESSYHEYGEVQGNIELKKGHVVLENTAKVGTIIVNPTENANVSVGTNGGTVGAVVKKQGVTNATITIDSKLTATEITDEQETEMKKFAGGIGTEASPYLIEKAEQFVNIGTLSEAMASGTSYSFKMVADIDLRTVESFSEFGSKEFAAITGYFCGTLDGKKDNQNNYKLIANDNLDYIFVDANKSVTLSNIDYYYENSFVPLCYGTSTNTSVVFDNVDMYMVDTNGYIEFGSNNGLYTAFIGYDDFTDKWHSDNSVTIKNADVYVDIVGIGYNAVFFGSTPYYGGSATVIDSTYYGKYYGEKVNLVLGNQAHLPNGTYTLVATNVKNKGTLAATGGNPMIAGGNYETNTQESKFGTYTNVSLGISRYLFDSNLGISYDDNGLKIKAAASDSTDYYVLTIRGGTRLVSPVSENSAYAFSVRIEKSNFVNGEYQTNFKDGKLATVAQYKEFVDGNATFDSTSAIELYGENGEFWMVEKDGTMYYVFDFHDNGEKHFVTKSGKVITSSVVNVNSALITAYDSEGLPIAQKSIDLK